MDDDVGRSALRPPLGAHLIGSRALHELPAGGDRDVCARIEKLLAERKALQERTAVDADLLRRLPVDWSDWEQNLGTALERLCQWKTHSPEAITRKFRILDVLDAELGDEDHRVATLQTCILRDCRSYIEDAQGRRGRSGGSSVFEQDAHALLMRVFPKGANPFGRGAWRRSQA